MIVCNICNAVSPDYSVLIHTLGCPIIWETVWAKAGEWENAILAKTLYEETVALDIAYMLPENLRWEYRQICAECGADIICDHEPMSALGICPACKGGMS